MIVKVLGSAAGGGFPQWNCGCKNCSRLRSGVFKGTPRTQTQVAISPDQIHWFLLNASPDLRQQLLSHSAFAPAQNTRETPVAGIILTSADSDCVMGLLHLREFQPLVIYATESVARAVREENSLFHTLERSNPPVRWEILTPGKKTSVWKASDNELTCRAISVGGDFPDYVSDALRKNLRREEAVLALELGQDRAKFFFSPTLPQFGTDLLARASRSKVAMLDGTFWTDNELIDVRGAGKTARQIGHLPLSGAGGLLEEWKNGNETRRILVHLNNTNPALDEESDARRTLEHAGWEIAYDGMEFAL